MSTKTPAINSYGVYSAILPYVIASDVRYRCTGLNLISALLADNTDVYALYYENLGIDIETYEDDKKNDVAIVTLSSSDGPEINIPSSFIEELPTLVTIPYSRIIISADMGLLPDTLNMGQLVTDIKDMIDGRIGVNSIVKLNAISNASFYTVEEDALLESNRLAAIADSDTLSYKYSKLVDELTAALDKIVDLETVIIANS